MHPFRSMTRQEAIEIDPRIEHVDAFVVVKDTHDFWSRYSKDSWERPKHIRAMKWDQINPSFGFRLDEGLYLNWWFYVLDDSMVVCAIESDDPRVMDWAREFAEMWGVPAFEMGPTLDFAFRSGPLGDDHPYWNEVRAKGNNKEISCELSCIGLIFGGRVEHFRETDELLHQKLRRKWEERMEAERIRWENRPAPRVMPEQCTIPNISLHDLWFLNSHLQPLIEKGGELFWVKPCDDIDKMRNTSFVWDPKLENPASDVKPVATSTSLHSFGYHGFFKPSIAEVLAQAPENWQEFVGYSVEGPKEAFDINCEPHARDAGFHVATVTWYARA